MSLPFLYQLQNASYGSLSATDFDFGVVDMDDAGLTAAQVAALEKQGKGLVSYVSIGEAEDYRDYWQSGWNSEEARVPARREPRLARQLLGEILGPGLAEADVRPRRPGGEARLPGRLPRHRRRLPDRAGAEGLSRHRRRAAPGDDRLRHRALRPRQGREAGLHGDPAERRRAAGDQRGRRERPEHRLPEGDRRARGRGPLVRRQQRRRLDPGRPAIHPAGRGRGQVRARDLLPDRRRQAGRLRHRRHRRGARPLRRRPRPDRQDRPRRPHHRFPTGRA